MSTKCYQSWANSYLGINTSQIRFTNLKKTLNSLTKEKLVCESVTGPCFVNGLINSNCIFSVFVLDHTILWEEKGQETEKDSSTLLMPTKERKEQTYAIKIAQHLLSKLTVNSTYTIDSSYGAMTWKYLEDLLGKPGDVSYGMYKQYYSCFFTFSSSPELKTLGELIGWDSSRRPSAHTFKHEYL